MKSRDEILMERCIQLAHMGLGETYPNPMVGCVLIHEEKIISEGWHHKAGMPHAEVNAIQQITDKEILKNSTLYVSLEPCAHFGKTPPCSDLIIESHIPKVVVGTVDPFSEVNGLGIQNMRNAGIDVKVGVLESECRESNKRFFTFHQKKRPYIVLKWAQTADGFMATKNGEQKWITNAYSKQRVHLWRTQEQSILVGTETAKFDNPKLNARLWTGNQPVRIVLDRELKLNSDLYLFDQSQNTLVFTEKVKESKKNLSFIKIDFAENVEEQILLELYQKGIQSLIIEGGKRTLDSFIEKDLWDEARIFESKESWGEGVESPKVNGKLISSEKLADDTLKMYVK